MKACATTNALPFLRPGRTGAGLATATAVSFVELNPASTPVETVQKTWPLPQGGRVVGLAWEENSDEHYLIETSTPGSQAHAHLMLSSQTGLAAEPLELPSDLQSPQLVPTVPRSTRFGVLGWRAGSGLFGYYEFERGQFVRHQAVQLKGMETRAAWTNDGVVVVGLKTIDIKTFDREVWVQRLEGSQPIPE